MITAIINSHFTLFLSLGLGALFIFVVGLYLIFRSPAQKNKDGEVDVTDIAGDDVITTQLDLAKAYIEADRKHLAINILETVVKQGSRVQQEEAQRLLVSVMSG